MTTTALPPTESPPWAIPVPVAPMAAVPLHAGNARHAVCIDLSRIGAFAFEPAHDVDVAFADMQLNADSNPDLRLGSGRAVTYAGAYIKGIGRTQLAANWRASHDLYHASGHLFPSAAAREYLVSRHLAGRGLASAIVACDGVLLSPAPPEVAGLATRIAAATSRGQCPPAPIDTRLLALSVLSLSFVCFSYVLWALSRTGSHDPVAPVLRAFRAILDVDVAGAVASRSGCTPSDFATALGRAVDRGLAAFLAYPLAGVYFGSFHNNFTADGRFLDLETPVVVAAPFVGALAPRDQMPTCAELPNASIPGLEVAELAFQVRAFLDAADGQLARIADGSRRVTPKASAYVAELREAMRAAFPDTHPVRSVDALEAMLASVLGRALRWSPRQAQLWGALLRARLARRAGREPEAVNVTFRKVPIAPANPEPGYRVDAWSIDGSMPDGAALDAGVAFAQALALVEAETDVAGALDALRAAERTLMDAARGIPAVGASS